ncbi:MAG: YraN family protein [Arenimonas sp.]
MSKAAHLVAGENAEQAACDFLLTKQLKLIERNIRYPFGEIDLLMQDGKELVFVEVRFRHNQSFGGGVESVTISKRKKMANAAQAWLSTHKQYVNTSCRFDVVSIDIFQNALRIDWIKAAFDLEGIA